MCGIHLIVDKKELLSDTASIKSMVSAGIHRGPDNRSSVWVRNREIQYFLGANRLKIRDQSDLANQPFKSEDEQYFLLFNGEIYNYAELKNELISKGYQFRTSSDTEVLFYLLKEESEVGLGKLQGMFSIIFLDRSANTVLIARDKHGIKPLFYSQNENFFVASSESKPIFKSNLIAKELIPSEIDLLLRYKHSFGRNTIFKNLFSVSPGKFIKLENGIVTKDEFIIERTTTKENELNVKAIEQLLVDSLYNQLSDSVPYGLFLSGGLDSSLLLALNRKYEINYLQTFSIIDKTKVQGGLNDSRLSRLAAKLYGYDHHEIHFTDQPDEEDIHNYIAYLDQPVLDSGSYMNYILTKEASKFVKVVLSGAGADEYWYGYPRYQVYRQMLKNPLVARGIKELLRFARFSGLSKVDPVTDRRFKRVIDTVEGSKELSWNNLLQVPLLQHNELPSVVRKFIEEHEEMIIPQLWDQKNYLVNDVLLQSDQMTMSQSIEMRLPYLDDDLVKAASRLQSSFHDSGRSKPILSEIFMNIEGSTPFVKRTKEGMGLPFYSWINSNYIQDRIEKLINKKDSLIHETDSYRRLVNRKNFRKELTDQANGSAVWSLVALDLWLEHNL
ncbi:asparagine synthase (glutamine-hydrolyzing) [Marinigracilibium pacificum]|uniref:asparagine synthase (glutamine-hydrolyzing) n=1 Tax=Marinigracilibium pacificum TaxID=2729599 RepID=A0A848IUV8_9BACT|nr:asparagine synthase (glutamine-hydrolyzing) [Marinigracilibium pacificum]NMM47075.1 asparagine synthase (glutamine-hydrolyzing) [Marinigracilibium pacificum]